MEEECGNGYDFFDNGHYSYGINLEYGYDANGNVTMDVNKGIIGISYDHNNLPIDIDFSNDSKLQYLYDAAGNKLRQDVIQSKTLQKRTDFISNFVLINNYPYWLNFDEGRVILNRGEVTFTETHIKDHLGNTRLAIGRSDNALVVKQVNSFYPFGMNIKGLTTSYNMPVTKAYPPNEYLYNGKMFQDELGLDWLDYGARMYDGQLGRWHTVDNKAEKYFALSPYVYGANNSLRFIDPNGNEIVDANGRKITYSNKTGWSSNATESVKIVHQSLMQTETGVEQWNKAYSSDRKMSFEISDENGNNNGITNREFTQNIETREVFLDKDQVQEIIIYEGTLENNRDYRYKDLSLREAVGVVAGHEIEHATNEQNIKEEAINVQFGYNMYDIEKAPNEIGKKIVNESKSQVINKMEPKPAFNH